MNTTTQIITIDLTNTNKIQQYSLIQQAAAIIKTGGTVAFPTETVYGLGANALNPNAIKKIFKAKNRPSDNPLIVHISSREQIHDLARNIPKTALKLADTFWPGPLTMILKRKKIVPDITTCNLDTVAVRMPDNPIALKLITLSGVPIAAPSANLSGRPSPTTARHVINDLNGRIDAIIDAGPVEIGVESTVVDMTSSIPVILRPGRAGIEELRECIGEIRIGYKDQTTAEKEIVRSPGMKYTHYSPRTKVVLVEGGEGVVADMIIELILKNQEDKISYGLLVLNETAEHIAEYITIKEMFSLGKRNKPSDAAYNLFAGLRYLDERNVDVIIVDGSLGHEGIGEAIWNRLSKAADEIIDVT
jgi:L-threonylcarbamoyladenylate synthase